MNAFKPASETVVGDAQKNVSAVEKRLEIQNLRLDRLVESMEKADEVASDNAELL